MEKVLVYYTPGKSDELHPYQLLAAGHSIFTESDGSITQRYQQHTFILTLEGAGLVQYPGGILTAPAGSIVWLDTSKTYAHGTHPDHSQWRYLWLGARGPHLDRLYPTTERLKQIGGLSFAKAQETFESSIELISEHDEGIGAEATILVARIVSLLAGAKGSTASNNPHSVGIVRAMAECKNSLSEAWTVARLAECAVMSQSHFHKQFRQRIGMTPMEWVRLQRVNAAKYALATTRRSIAEIGRSCGYPDAYHFSREFARTAGMPPSRFRKSAGL